VFPAFSSREVTLGQMRKIGIHFIIYSEKDVWHAWLIMSNVWWKTIKVSPFTSDVISDLFFILLHHRNYSISDKKFCESSKLSK